jgi:hypothetical protein
VLTAENRTVLAYDIVPTADEKPVTVTVATEDGWSLAGVLGAFGTSAQSAVGLIAERGLDASLRPIVPGQGGGVRLDWVGQKLPTPGRQPARAAKRATKTTRTRKRER